MPLAKTFSWLLAAGTGLAAAVALVTYDIQRHRTELYDAHFVRYSALTYFRNPAVQTSYTAFLSRCTGEFTKKPFLVSFSDFVVDDDALPKDGLILDKISAQNFDALWPHRYKFPHANYNLSLNGHAISTFAIKVPVQGMECFGTEYPIPNICWAGIPKLASGGMTECSPHSISATMNSI